MRRAGRADPPVRSIDAEETPVAQTSALETHDGGFPTGAARFVADPAAVT
jgi:hypothetical protein